MKRQLCLGRSVQGSGHCHITDTISHIRFAKQEYLSQRQMCCQEAGVYPAPYVSSVLWSPVLAQSLKPCDN